MKHNFVTHTAADHEFDSTGRHCPICNGGLKLCTVCGGAEASLPTDCPGSKLTPDQEEGIITGHLDYQSGIWIDPRLRRVSEV